MIKFFHLILGLFILVSIGCGSDVIKIKIINEVAISGIVADITTSNAMSGVEIKLEDKSTVTDKNGYYKIDGLQAGEYELIAIKEGYYNLYETVNLSVKRVNNIFLTNLSTPKSTPTPAPIMQAVPVQTVAPSASQSPATTSSPVSSTIYDSMTHATVNGHVYDDSGKDADGVTLHAVSLNSTRPFDATATSTLGSYVFTGVPTGVTIQVTATKAGYTTRVRTIVPLSNTQGLSSTNTLDFGGTSDGVVDTVNALSDKPEVTAITPAYNSTEVASNTSFDIKFSEPMDKNSVVDNFIIIDGTTNEILATTENYDASWNPTNDEVTFTPKSGYSLQKMKQYAVSFKSDKTTGIKDSNGILARQIDLTKNDGCFRVTSVFKGKVPFTTGD